MKRIAAMMALALAGGGVAHAQVLGGGVTGAAGGAVGGVTGGAAVDGAARIDPAPALDGATGTVRDLDDSARKASRDAARRADRVKPDAKVKAQAGARVERGTRCYAYDDTDRYNPYDPVYRDGYYYCEWTGPAVAAGARVKTR